MVLTKTVVLEDAEMNQVFWTKCRAVHECGEWLVRFNFPGKVQRFVMKLGDFYCRLAGGLIPRPMSGGFSQFVVCLANRPQWCSPFAFLYFIRSFCITLVRFVGGERNQPSRPPGRSPVTPLQKITQTIF